MLLQQQEAQWRYKLTHRAFSSDGHRLQQDLDDTGSDPRRVPVVGVQVVENLLDDVMGVLSLCDDTNQEEDLFIYLAFTGLL